MTDPELKQKVLVITQKIDSNDPILGFFHSWIEGISKNSAEVTVICLELGECHFAGNVRVLSLGKEKKKSRFKYVFNFYRYIWKERKNYQVVFVHMNQEYVVLGGWLWKILGKKIYFWRNHKIGNLITTTAVYLSNQVFCTSTQSYTARFEKTLLMPVGIDTNFFKPDKSISVVPRSILALGRISPVKRLEILIEALLELQRQNIKFSCSIVGSPISKQDIDYQVSLITLAGPLIKAGSLTFQLAVSPSDTPNIYRKHEIYVNVTPAGSMDKTIFEAMACGSLVLVRNEEVVTNLANQLIVFLNNSKEEKEDEQQANRGLVEKNHSLTSLISQLVIIFKS